MRVVSNGAQTFELRSLIGGIYLPALFFGIGQWMIIPAIPQFADELGASVFLSGVIFAARGAGSMVGDVPSGLLVSRLGGRATMTTGVLLTAATAAAMGFSSGPMVLGLFTLLNGVAFALWHVSRLAYLTETVPTEYRGRALSLVGGVTRVGFFAGPIIGGVLGTIGGLETVFFAQALVILIAALLVATRLPEMNAGDAGVSGRETVSLRSVALAERRSLLVAGSVAVTLVLIRHGRQFLIPVWGREALDLNPFEIGLVFGFASAIDMAMFYPVGVVMDRWGRKWTIVPSLVVLSTSLLLMPLTGGFVSFLLVGLLSGFGNGLGSGAVMTLGADLAPREATGPFLGLWRLVGDTGAVAAPPVVGAIEAVLTLGTAAVSTGAIGIVGGVVMLLLVRETLSRSRPSSAPG
ncbi:MAG: MFS transporter [Dehalococcoidia bacterium]|nr:MFS transporter [Dehalococcoidia bacterium]HCV00828.1 MFS transporter [Dehalococcoidia bacterium]|tara:strand:+ start:552 stop:1775 length:1224 start_codon:yes stop_codon:yes gene_type:complete